MQFPARPGHAEPGDIVKLIDLEARHLRIDQQADRGRECRPLRRLRQAGDTERATDAYIATENATRRFRQTRQLEEVYAR